MNLYREETEEWFAIHLRSSETMIARLLILSVLFAVISAHSTFPEVMSYAKVSKYGTESRSMDTRPISWFTRARTKGNSTAESAIDGRNAKDIAITVSPVYIPSKVAKLKNGEAIDHPSTAKYSTLDHEMIAQLDEAKKQIAARFHPPANFEQTVSHVKPTRQKPLISESGPRPDTSEFPGSYEYQPDFLVDKPISKPITIDTYPSRNPATKGSDSYKQDAGPFVTPVDHQMDFPDFSSAPSYPPEDFPKVNFPGDHANRPSYDEDHFPDGHGGYHEVIYDHLPEFHDHPHHHYEEHSTMEPEMNDQRLDKRPYSYYFIGKKLWYIPLYFSIYFIIYVAALVLKSVARHKINFPAQLAEAAGHGRRRDDEEYGWWNLTGRVLEGIESFAQRFGKES